jgi:hypothetical protein
MRREGRFAGPVRAIEYDRAGGRVAIRDDGDGFIHVFPTDGSPGDVVLRAAGSALRASAWSPDGRFVASATGHDAIALWDATTGAEVRRFEGHGGWAIGAAFSSDGRRLVSSAVDTSARVWDVETGKALTLISGLPMSQDNRARFVHRDRLVKVGERWLFHADTGRPYATIPLRPGDRAVEVDPDGEHLVFVGPAHRLRRLPLDPIAHAAANPPRDLEPSELDRYEIGTVAEREAYFVSYTERWPTATGLFMHGMRRLKARDVSGALELFRRAEALRANHPYGPFGVACALSLGLLDDGVPAARRQADESAAFAALERAVDLGIDARRLEQEPSLAALRARSRFAEILARARGGG